MQEWNKCWNKKFTHVNYSRSEIVAKLLHHIQACSVYAFILASNALVVSFDPKNIWNVSLIDKFIKIFTIVTKVNSNKRFFVKLKSATAMVYYNKSWS